MGWSQITAKKETPDGQWEHWTYGMTIQGWSLRCGPMFYADVRRVGEHGNYFATLNSWVIGNDPNPQVLMHRVEEEIIKCVRLMLPAYKVLHARCARKMP